MNESLREVAKALYGVGNSLSCKVCVKCKEKKVNENLSCVDCIEDGLKNLIDRATPKRPKKSIPLTKLDKFLGNQQLFICPTCGNSCLCRYATNGRNENKYCYDCGQAIDWGKEEAEKALEARKNEN